MEEVKYDQLYLITQNYLFGKRVVIVWEWNLYYAYINLYIYSLTFMHLNTKYEFHGRKNK